MSFSRLVLLALVFTSTEILSEFIVNVKTQAGNVIKQSIKEDVADSSIMLEYKDWDLTKVTQVVDFKSNLNLFQIIVYGEMDLNQPPFQVLCFLSYFKTAEFIEPGAVSKLRQVYLILLMHYK